MAVKGKEKELFKKVAASERKILFRALAAEKQQIIFKGTENEQFFSLVANQVEKEDRLICSQTVSSVGIKKDQKVSGNFALKNERYYFYSEISFQDNWAILKINIDVYKLQRRANARVHLPDNYDCVFMLTKHLDKSLFVSCQLKDFSAGGLKIEVHGSEPRLKAGDTLSGTLRLGKRRPMDFDLEVRFVKASQEDDKIVQVAGLQFLSRSNAIENRLLLLMMDIQRELYLRFS